METTHNPCKECPYRKDSLPGYLGECSHQPEKFLQQLNNSDLHPCHLLVDWEQETINTDKPICVGALQFMNNSCKRSYSQKILKLQDKVGKNDEVISYQHNFIQHHSKK